MGEGFFLILFHLRGLINGTYVDCYQRRTQVYMKNIRRFLGAIYVGCYRVSTQVIRCNNGALSFGPSIICVICKAEDGWNVGDRYPKWGFMVCHKKVPALTGRGRKEAGTGDKMKCNTIAQLHQLPAPVSQYGFCTNVPCARRISSR